MTTPSENQLIWFFYISMRPLTFQTRPNVFLSTAVILMNHYFVGERKQGIAAATVSFILLNTGLNSSYPISRIKSRD